MNIEGIILIYENMGLSANQEDRAPLAQDCVVSARHP